MFVEERKNGRFNIDDYLDADQDTAISSRIGATFKYHNSVWFRLRTWFDAFVAV